MQITHSIKKSAADLFSAHPHWERLYVNERGEFFTREDYASNSVEGRKNKFAEISPREVADLIKAKQAAAAQALEEEEDEDKGEEAAPTPKEATKRKNLKTS